MQSLCCLLLASLLLVAARPAAAEPATAARRELRLSWVRSASASSCPDVARVESDVEHRLGWSPFVPTSSGTESIEVAVDRNAEVWRASIELRAADGASLGSRSVESSANTCSSLASAAGLAIALMIDPFLPPDAPVKPANVAAPPAKPPAIVVGSVQQVGATDSASATAARSDSRLSAGLGGLGVVNVLPKFAVGVTLGGGVRLVDRLYVAVSGSLLPEQHVLQGGADVGFGMTLGTAGVCYRVPIAETFGISSCASLLLASMQVTVKNPEPVAAGSRLWWAGSAGIRLGWNWSHFDATLGIDALGHPVRHTYLIDSAEPVSSTSSFVEPAVGAAASLTAGVCY